LQPAENGAALDQKLGLVRTPAQTFRQNLNGVDGLFQSVQEAGQV
jgi:hypothetical protein